MAPKRRSLRERDQRAIEPPPLPDQTAIDMPGAPEPAAPRSEVAVAPPMGTRIAASPAPGATRAGARRFGIYFYPAEFTAAKAAYLADWQNGGNAATFATWIGGVLVGHAQLDPAQRATTVLPVRTGGAGSTRSFTLPQHVHDAVRAAQIADQDAGRWVSTSTWAAAAIHAGVQAAEQRTDGHLSAPPTRLPNRLQR